MSTTNRKAAKSTTSTTEWTYPGPAIPWGCKFLRVNGVFVTLRDLTCDWKARQRYAFVEYADGSTASIKVDDSITVVG